MDDLENKIRRLAADLEQANIAQTRNSRANRAVVQVVDGGSHPTAGPAYVAGRTCDVAFSETEGATPTVTAGKGSITVGVLGATIPAVGSWVIAKAIGPRWVTGPFPSMSGGGGGGTVTIPNCACPTMPTSLAFAGGTLAACGNEFPPDTIAYGPTPAVFAGTITASNCFLGQTTFLDPSSGTYYRYYLGCDPSALRLAKIYYPSGGGGSYLTSVRYSWPPSGPGNSCSPFKMVYGVPYAGGNPACKLTLYPS